jgi:signal recognition particle GTPase
MDEKKARMPMCVAAIISSRLRICLSDGKVSKMGSIRDILGFCWNGCKNLPIDEVDDRAMDSRANMTVIDDQGRSYPSILNASRRKRIGAGSGQQYRMYIVDQAI